MRPPGMLGLLDGQYNVPSSPNFEALELVVTGWQADLEQETIFLERSGMALTWGYRQGHIIDRPWILAENGIKHGFINAGGDIGILGKPDGPWRIGVRHP